MRRLWLSLFLAAGVAGGAWAAPFIHPGLLHDGQDLAFMRAKVSAKEEPWYGSFVELTNDYRCRSYYPFQAWAVVTSNAPFAGSTTSFRQDPYAAYVNALAWALTSNFAFADRALAILNAWSSTLAQIDGNYNGANQGQLLTAWAVHPFCNAAELLRASLPADYWTAEDQARFAGMLTNLCAPQITHFAPDYHGNWGAAMMASVASMGVYLDDPALFAKATNAYLRLGTGSFNLCRLTNYIYATGQCEESGRDQGHVHMGLGAFLILCEVAWKQGADLYGAHDDRLALGVEYLARYNLGYDELPGPWVMIPPAVTWTQLGSNERGNFVGIYELPYQRYHYDRGRPMPFTEQVIGLTNWGGTDGFTHSINFSQGRNYRPESGWAYGEGFGTLAYFRGPSTNNQSSNAAPCPPLPATALSATELKASEWKLSWTMPLSNGAEGYVLERSSGSGPWQTLFRAGSNSDQYRDPCVPLGAPTRYRLAATNGAGASSWCETGPITAARRLAWAPGELIPLPASRSLRVDARCLAKNFDEPLDLVLEIRRGAVTVISAISNSSGAALAVSNDWTGAWPLPSSFEPWGRLDILVEAWCAGAPLGIAWVFSNVDLMPLWAAQGDFSKLAVFNNPWRMGGPDLSFANLPAETTLTIFSISGRRMAEYQTPSGSPSACLNWNPGTQTAPGIYLAVFRSPGVAQRMVKLVVKP